MVKEKTEFIRKAVSGMQGQWNFLFRVGIKGSGLIWKSV